MLKRHIWRTGTALVVLVALAALVAARVAPAASHTAKASKVVIWTDHDRLAAVTKVANEWASARGASVQVVEKQFGNIQNDLGTVQAANAPDVVVAAHDWTGALAANGSVVPLFPSKAVKKQFPSYTLDAFSYGKSVKRLYGMPTQVENIALIVNTKLAKAPTSWADLERRALAFKHKKKGNLAIAVQQGANGDAYHMYPFFSGLCGYVFGRNRAGNLDARNVGVGAARFLQQREAGRQVEPRGPGQLVRHRLDREERVPEEAGRLLHHRPVEHGHDQAGRDQVQDHAAAEDRVPLGAVPRRQRLHGHPLRRRSRRRDAGEGPGRELHVECLVAGGARRRGAPAPGEHEGPELAVRDAVLNAFGRASVGGVPMPNIPQMNAVWSELGGAWVKSTKGAGATKARVAFSTAARNIRNKISGG